MRPFFRDLYFRLSGPLDNPTVLIVLCVVCVAVLVILRAWKR